MQITSATSPKTATDDPAAIAAATPKKTVLGQDDFLKLLAIQFQSQDPMKPMEDTAFIAQMAQFTALDQSKSLLAQMTHLSTSQDMVTANSYIGRHVTLDAGADLLVSGDVTGVELSDGTPRLMVGDKTYPLSAVLLVEPAKSTTAPTSVATTP
jgi:flagellar basal-body rod modification protein FlgD